MRILIDVQIITDDGSSPLFEDVEEAIHKQLAHLELSWNDPSLGRVLAASINVLNVDDADY